MCLRNLFDNGNCSWLLFAIIVLLLIDDDCCNQSTYNDDCGCGR